MKLIDSNIIIYSASPNYSYLRPLVMDSKNYYSSVTKIEVLGFEGLTHQEKTYFESIFQVLNMLDLKTNIIEKAIQLKQKRKIKLGDSIIAATAIEHKLNLYTRNVGDFNKISKLKVTNPIKQA